MRPNLEVGDVVEKMTGDYTFIGTVVAVFEKIRRGDHSEWRIVVEDTRGLLLIMNDRQIRKVELHDEFGEKIFVADLTRNEGQ